MAGRGTFLYVHPYSAIKYALINGSNAVTTEVSNLKNFYGLTKNGGRLTVLRSLNRPRAAHAPMLERRLPIRIIICSPNDQTFADLASQFPITGWYPIYANFLPYGLQAGDPTAAISHQSYSPAFISYKHNKLQGR